MAGVKRAKVDKLRGFFLPTEEAEITCRVP